MMHRPIQYKGRLLYPVQQDACTGCEFNNSDLQCAVFRKFVVSTTSHLTACSDTANNDSHIWKAGEDARLEYITNRLTT